MKAVIIAIGDELLNGQTIDTNSSWLGRRLNEIGVEVIRKLTVADKESEIVAALKSVHGKVTLILTTGGLGPTKDDITIKAIAEFIGDQLVFNQHMYDDILAYFDKIGHIPTEAHRQQCFMPASALLMENTQGTAPGMWMEKDRKVIFSMPGIPYEMKSIMNDGGLAKIQSLNSEGQAIEHFIIQTTGLGETHISETIEDILNEFPSDLKIAYLPSVASVKLRISGIGKNRELNRKSVELFGNRIKERLGNVVYGIGELSLAEALGELCLKKGLTIGTAESCTGGYIAHLITEVPGSSSYFEGSVVSYSNHIKSSVLQVAEKTLEEHGAVSEETVCEMVTGVIDRLHVDVAVAVSGIAGPSGGTEDKPVGTVWIAAGNKLKLRTKKLQLSKNRILNIKYSSIRALNEIRLFIQEDIG